MSPRHEEEDISSKEEIAFVLLCYFKLICCKLHLAISCGNLAPDVVPTGVPGSLFGNPSANVFIRVFAGAPAAATEPPLLHQCAGGNCCGTPTVLRIAAADDFRDFLEAMSSGFGN